MHSTSCKNMHRAHSHTMFNRLPWWQESAHQAELVDLQDDIVQGRLVLCMLGLETYNLSMELSILSSKASNLSLKLGITDAHFCLAGWKHAPECAKCAVSAACTPSLAVHTGAQPVSGVVIRGSRISWDLRKTQPCDQLFLREVDPIKDLSSSMFW